MGLFNFFTQEIAMDLGTANTLIIHNDEVVVNEPSIVALNRNNLKEVLGVGKNEEGNMFFAVEDPNNPESVLWMEKEKVLNLDFINRLK